MAGGKYLAIMLGVMAVGTLVTVPSLFFKKCPHCGIRNGLDATDCRRCGKPFPADE